YSNLSSSVQCCFLNTLSILSNHCSASRGSTVPLNSVAPYFINLSYCLVGDCGCTTGVCIGT
ncbi:hypothetical protein P3X46_002514, partial [Hevea brasiliensis]